MTQAAGAGSRFDIVVAGAGPVGLAFAASLRGTGLSIALVDPTPEASLADPPEDGREIALTDRSVSILQEAGAWDRIPPEAIAPLRSMRVLNGPSDYALQFGEPGADGLIGRFAPNHWLRRTLFAVVAGDPDVTLLSGRSVTGGRAQGARIAARISDGAELRCRLLVAADTRRSALRAQQNISASLHDYRQRMLVCPVTHERPNEAIATAWFEYGRTLVTLPLNGGRSSVVMTLPPDDAANLLAMDDDAFGREITERYRHRLGVMRPAGTRHAVPVLSAYASRFVSTRFALLGDAAVGMHPTTAHGLNFGLLGQQALAGVIRDSLQAGRDIADPAALRRYEAAHRSETRLFFAGAEAIMRLYADGDALPARLLRDAALRIGNLPPLRRVLSGRMRAPDG
ncbi:5-demethoxyubiquinol-8 5-hydroxylase UbiM [Acetobacteraceae bacterium KSS8]|uniref:5-demethoxyubiquinol-8 5-hydroxylase UbiM n=1 Tax=Endosaccharibacter trunci TaxID=2812733 RepID=A0ABT1W9L6_9PROT|nr:5-demethoxyubiquinol-8 5-hydroxylase UbiM [Acetobacteraceae bacterium KSS8]